MWWLPLVTQIFILLHVPTGQEIEVNAAEISSMRKPRENEGHFARGTKCLLTMTNGKINGVVESCETVYERIREAKRAG